ncbi:MAG TPA: hypothetical protein VF221_07870 [Chloroflexota bacterium]
MPNNEGTIRLDIREYMDYGLDVYDANSKRVGSVDDFDRVAGYIMVRSNPFADRDLYIPFSIVTHIDPRDLFVSDTKQDLLRKYSDPPPRSILVEERTDVDTGEDDSRAITSSPSGYDGTPVVVDEAKIGKLAHHIAPGFHVYSWDMESVGTVKQYDRETKQMLVERGVFSKHDLRIPIAAIDMVDRDGRDIYLAISSADLKRMQNEGPGSIVTIEITETS